jgi:5-(carboxyamino)imidazole ribonucleotide synthase
VNPAHFDALEQRGRDVYPSSRTLAYLTDKLVQRRRLAERGIPGPKADVCPDEAAARDLVKQWGYPLVLKARHGGYDGYGVRIIKDPTDWEMRLPLDLTEWYAEEYVPFARELAVMVARGRDGALAVYPVTESVQTSDGHRCDTVTAPAPALADSARDTAADIAARAVEAVDGVGLFGVELFLKRDGSVLLNEMAPRPHNSGHYTMDCSATSQFEQHIRSVCGLALGPTHLLGGGGAMVNLLGTTSGVFDSGAAVERALRASPQTHLHWYGKRETRMGRKMGHINALADTATEALAIAKAARKAFWSLP